MPAEAMSVEEMQGQLHAASVCLVRCGMRACEGTIAQARRSACCAPAYLRNSILPEKAVSLAICPWEKSRGAELKKELCFVTIFSVVARNFTFYMKK